MKKIIIAESILDAVGKNRTVFGRGGITVIPAGSAEDILELHRRERCDLVIADQAQPVMGGVRLCEVLRADEALRDVSIILVCDGAQASLQDCRDSVANAMIVRPVDPMVLFSKTSELLVVPQRQAMRVMLRVSVDGGTGGTPFFATSENISISGLLLESNYPFQLDDRIACSFFVGHSEVKVDGIVTRIDRSATGKKRFGVKFLNPSTKALVVIDHFIKSRSGSAGPGREP
jgi:CheY-like chemotaxis protein